MSTEQLIKKFKQRYSEFIETSGEIVGFFMDDAMLEISLPRWGSLYERGLLALTAHYLALEKRRIDSNGSAVNPVASETAGSLSVSYSTTAPASGDETYSTTAYGQEYLRLRKLVGVGFMVA